MSEVTRILSDVASGDPHAADELLPLVYDELRKLAAAQLAREAPGNLGWFLIWGPTETDTSATVEPFAA